MTKFIKQIENYNKGILQLLFKLFVRNEAINPPINFSIIDTILLLRTDRIGDMAVSIPLIRLLKKRFPNLSIYIFASKINAPLIADDPDISGVFIKKKNIFSILNQLLKIRNKKIDLSLNLNLNKSLTNAILSHFAVPNGIKVASAYNDEFSNFYNCLIEIKRNNEIPMALLLLKFLELFDIQESNSSFKVALSLSSTSIKRANDLLEKVELGDTKFIIFNISSSHENRNTTDEFVIELLRRLFNRTAEPILLISDIAQQKRLHTIRRSIQNNKLKVLPAVDLQTLTAVISKSEITITPDTAIVHIACGVNIPVAAFYTREEQFYNEWQPIGVKSVSIFAEGNSHVSEIDPLKALEKIMQLYGEISVNE